MNEEHERILRQLREAADAGIDSEAFFQTLRKALEFGPAPREVVREIWKKRTMAAGVQEETPLISPEQERAMREGLRRHHEPSDRARDPNHPVGAVAHAIRAALPDFRSWQVDVSSLDLNRLAGQLGEDRTKALSYLLPPDFAEMRPGAYITAARGFVVKDADGAIFTESEWIRKATTREACAAQMRQGGRFSDVLSLLWKRLEPIELQTVEEQLRQLAGLILPGTPVQFRPHQDHHYRSALRMQLGDDPRPAAIGGPCSPSPRLPEGIYVASATVYLEPWASTQSGQIIDLAEESPFPSMA